MDHATKKNAPALSFVQVKLSTREVIEGGTRVLVGWVGELGTRSRRKEIWRIVRISSLLDTLFFPFGQIIH
jgi:hypothetical protein